MNKLLLLFIFSAFLHAQTTNVSLILPWKHQFQFAGYYVAKELGLYEKAGINVTILEHNMRRNIPKNVASQEHTFGVTHSSLLIHKVNSYNNITFLAAINQSSPLVLMTLKRNNIHKLEDLQGKKLMMGIGESEAASINAMLFSVGLQKNDFELFSTDFNSAALLDGTADARLAYISNEPFTLQEKGIEYTIFNPKEYGYNFYGDILFTSSEIIKNNPQLVEAFLNATLQGWEYAYQNIEESVEIILKKYNTQRKTKEALVFEAKVLKQLSYKNGLALGNLNAERLNTILNTYKFLGFIDKNLKVDPNTFIYKHIQLPSKKEDKHLLQAFYKQYKSYILLSSFFIFLIMLHTLFFRERMKSLVQEQAKELQKNTILFDTYIFSSKTNTKGVITSVSQAYCDFTGYTKEEFVGKSFNILQDPSYDSQELYSDLWLTLSSGHVWRGSFQNIKKDGSPYTIHSIISPIIDKHDKLVGYEDIKTSTPFA